MLFVTLKISLSASAVNHAFIIGGAIRSFGVLYVEIMERFDTSAEAAAWIIVFSQSSTLYLGEQ